MKVSELSAELLDYWVARAEGKVETFKEWRSTRASYWRPSTMGQIAVPIMERERIGFAPSAFALGEWCAAGNLGAETYIDGGVLGGEHMQTGPTPLIAAMRCYVASKFGAEVPDEVRA